MEAISTIGLDLAKHVFQAHGADSSGAVVVRKRLRRDQVLTFLAALPPCTVSMEACAGGHYWGREIAKLGHAVKLIAPAYVKPFVKRQKNDACDAEAICEAAQRPTMRFVAVKSEEAQAAAMVFRTRDLLVRQRTQAINALRGHLAEFGVVVAKGPFQVPRLIPAIEDPASKLPETVRVILAMLVDQLRALDGRVAQLDREIARRAKEDAIARRLMTIPGIGAVTATALAARSRPPLNGARLARCAGASTRPLPKQLAVHKSIPMAKNAKTNAVAYLRTSSAANIGADKDSEKRQRAAIESFARRAGYEIVATYYDEAISGADPLDSRPGFTAMLERIAGNGVRTIIVEMANRFARDLIVQETGYERLKGLVTLSAQYARGFGSPVLGGYVCGLAPRGECIGSEEPMSRSAGELTGNGEDVVGCGVHREEPLRRARRFEALHLPLSSSDRDM